MRTIHLTPSSDKRQLDELRVVAAGLLDDGKSILVTVAEEDEVLSPQEAAQRLRFSRQHVMRLVEAGELDGEQLPGSSYWQIPLASVVALEERRASARERSDAFSRELDALGAPPE